MLHELTAPRGGGINEHKVDHVFLPLPFARMRVLFLFNLYITIVNCTLFDTQFKVNCTCLYRVAAHRNPSESISTPTITCILILIFEFVCKVIKQFAYCNF